MFLAVLILAGCGGSPHAQPQVVHGRGFTFNAPAGWKVTASKTTASAAHDSQLVQVATFPLLHAYDDSLFDKVKKELDARMQAVAKQAGGTVTGASSVTAGGTRSHSYEVTAGDQLLAYTFVLRDMREYELLCRRPASSGDDACAQLLRSFSPGS